MKRIAIVGAGLSGLTAAWQLTREPAARTSEPVEVTLFESSPRLGGTIETVVDGGFLVELGPDSWVTEKPSALQLIRDLHLEHELLSSEDATRRTYLWRDGRLQPMPERMRLMVPIGRDGLAAIDASPLFSPKARRAFHEEPGRAEELRRCAPTEDESVASFVERHFGGEVLDHVAAPLLAGVFGGDVHSLSVRAVMAPFVAMERQHGSLILALEEREVERQVAGQPLRPIFTTLRSGLGSIVTALASQLPPSCLRENTEILAIKRDKASGGWKLEVQTTAAFATELFDEVVLATPAHVTASLLRPLDPVAAELLPDSASSAILVALLWLGASFPLLPGFGFLVPPSPTEELSGSRLLATTFVDQKFVGRVPAGGRLLRAFFGGAQAEALLRAQTSDKELAALALSELRVILGPLPAPVMSYVRCWPLSLPQYAVGHLERVATLERRIDAFKGLHLLGNSLHGVGLPDLILRARTLARSLRSYPRSSGDTV